MAKDKDAPKVFRLQVDIDSEVYRRAKAMAAFRGITLRQAVEDSLKVWLQEQESKAK